MCDRAIASCYPGADTALKPAEGLGAYVNTTGLRAMRPCSWVGHSTGSDCLRDREMFLLIFSLHGLLSVSYKWTSIATQTSSKYTMQIYLVVFHIIAEILKCLRH